MNTSHIPKFAAALLIVMASVIALMGTPAPQAPVANVEEFADIIAASDDIISPMDLSDKIIAKQPGLKIIDVRSPEMFATMTVPNSVNIPLSELLKKETIEGLSRKGEIVLVCGNGAKAAQAWVVLRGMGYNAYILENGMDGWLSMLEGNVSQDAEYVARVNALRAKFMGTGGAISAPVEVAPAPAVTPKKNKKRKKAEGGCS